MACRKIKFETAKLAYVARDKQTSKMLVGLDTTKAYYCNQCKAYHLGHKEKFDLKNSKTQKNRRKHF